jgi:hypothetical protein
MITSNTARQRLVSITVNLLVTSTPLSDALKVGAIRSRPFERIKDRQLQELAYASPSRTCTPEIRAAAGTKYPQLLINPVDAFRRYRYDKKSPRLVELISRAETNVKICPLLQPV